jgi:hypothetical protein
VLQYCFAALATEEGFVSDEDVPCREFPFFDFGNESFSRRERTH